MCPWPDMSRTRPGHVPDVSSKCLCPDHFGTSPNRTSATRRSGGTCHPLQSSYTSLIGYRSSTLRFRGLFHSLAYPRHFSMMCHGGGSYALTSGRLCWRRRPWKRQGTRSPSRYIPSSSKWRVGAIPGLFFQGPLWIFSRAKGQVER